MLPVRTRLGKLVLWTLLTLFLLTSGLPFLWTLAQSLKTNLQASSRTPVFFFTPTMENYRQIWLDGPGPRVGVVASLAVVLVVLVSLRVFANKFPWPNRVTSVAAIVLFAVTIWAVPYLVAVTDFYGIFVNSLIVSLTTCVISVAVASTSGYALARYAGPAAMFVLLAAVIFRALPPMGFALPYYSIAQITGLYDTRLLLIVVLTALNQPFALWLLRGFFRDVPREIGEAALMDGATQFVAFRKVVLPVAWPGIVATGLFTLLLAYQEFLLIQVLANRNTTLAVAGAEFLGGRGVATQVGVQSAAVVSATLPILLIVLLYQRHLVKGLSAGAVKG